MRNCNTRSHVDHNFISLYAHAQNSNYLLAKTCLGVLSIRLNTTCSSVLVQLVCGARKRNLNTLTMSAIHLLIFHHQDAIYSDHDVCPPRMRELELREYAESSREKIRHSRKTGTINWIPILMPRWVGPPKTLFSLVDSVLGLLKQPASAAEPLPSARFWLVALECHGTPPMLCFTALTVWDGTQARKSRLCLRRWD